MRGGFATADLDAELERKEISYIMLSVGCLLLLACAGAIAIPLEDFYPFGPDAGDVAIIRNDDGSSPAISPPSGFLFFGMMFTEIFVRILELLTSNCFQNTLSLFV